MHVSSEEKKRQSRGKGERRPGARTARMLREIRENNVGLFRHLQRLCAVSEVNGLTGDRLLNPVTRLCFLPMSVAKSNALQYILLLMSSSLRLERALRGSVRYRHDSGYQEISSFLRMQVRFFVDLGQIRFPDKV